MHDIKWNGLKEILKNTENIDDLNFLQLERLARACHLPFFEHDDMKVLEIYNNILYSYNFRSYEEFKNNLLEDIEIKNEESKIKLEQKSKEYENIINDFNRERIEIELPFLRFLVKLHQAQEYTNNLHKLFWNIREEELGYKEFEKLEEKEA